MLKVGLLGFTLENANKGCEALTYSFLYSLENVYEGKISVRYYSTSELYGEVRKFFPKISFSYYQLSRKNILINLRKDIITNCDIVFDISYGDGFSDIYNLKTLKWNTLVKQIVGKSKTPLILLPQTYGPFKNFILERQAANAIKHASVVMSRDKISTDYVKEISKVNALTFTDLAFFLPYEKSIKQQENKTIKIGINVSGLLWKGGFSQDNQFGLSMNYQEYVQKVIEHYLENKKYEIHLIPHVIETVNKSNDGDLYVNDLLSEKYSTKKAPAFSNPVETKNYIAQMDIVIAARMHATVDAFSSGVPVIAVSYSRKFEGLYGSLGYNYIVDANTIDTEDAVKKTIQWIDEKEELKIAEEKGMKQAVDMNGLFMDKLKEIISSADKVTEE